MSIPTREQIKKVWEILQEEQWAKKKICIPDTFEVIVQAYTQGHLKTRDEWAKEECLGREELIKVIKSVSVCNHDDDCKMPVHSLLVEPLADALLGKIPKRRVEEEELVQWMKDNIRIDMSVAIGGLGTSQILNDDGYRRIAHAIAQRLDIHK